MSYRKTKVHTKEMQTSLLFNPLVIFLSMNNQGEGWLRGRVRDPEIHHSVQQEAKQTKPNESQEQEG